MDLVTDQWVPLVRFDLADPVDLLTSHLCHDDAVKHFLDLCFFRKFQKALLRQPNIRMMSAGQQGLVRVKPDQWDPLVSDSVH